MMSYEEWKERNENDRKGSHEKSSSINSLQEN